VANATFFIYALFQPVSANFWAREGLPYRPAFLTIAPRAARFSRREYAVFTSFFHFDRFEKSRFFAAAGRFRHPRSRRTDPKQKV